MDLYFSKDGKCKISMINYLNKLIEYFLEVFEESALSSASSHLFQVRGDFPKFLGFQAHELHNITTKILFLSYQSRLEIHTSVVFMKAQVKEMDKDNQENMKMVVTLIHRTIELPLILREYSLNIVEWWVDGFLGFIHKLGVTLQ